MIKKSYLNIYFTSLFTLVYSFLFTQIPAYYNDVNLNLTGMSLKSELSTKIINTHTTFLSYSPDVWNVLKVSDLDPDNSANVMLIYGWNDLDGNINTDRTRNKDNNGGDVGEWNREHVYPQSLGTPELGTVSAGADAHNLKPCDVQLNGTRGNKKFASGSGNAGDIGPNWFPGEEWKGDVARILMYMYLRYPSQCKPGSSCVGTPVSIDLNMVEILLDWNALDPVSTHEVTRNQVIFNNQGNRNPFIDNPYLATLIWGGAITAENTWPNLSIEKYSFEYSIYPNPTINQTLFLGFDSPESFEKIELINLQGKIVFTLENFTPNTVEINDLPIGVLILCIYKSQAVLIEKIIIN